MGIAFRTNLIEDVTVGEQEQVFNVLYVQQYEFTCGVLEGTVVCESNEGFVSGCIVKAVNTETDDTYLGVTDDNGFYAICVPPGIYDIFVLNCSEECCEPIDCECGCGAADGDIDCAAANKKKKSIAKNKLYQAAINKKRQHKPML